MEGRQPPLSVTAKDCVYTPCYCEENVWLMCDLIRRTDPESLQHCYAVFISNERRKIPLWEQKNGQMDFDYQVVWDYHVLMIYRHTVDSSSWVFDLDTRLHFPCPFLDYIALAVRLESNIRDEYHRFFRIIRADVFLTHFASDRSHMLCADNKYSSPEPSYPCISTCESTNNLQSYISMKEDSKDDTSAKFGRVMDLQTFIDFFSYPIITMDSPITIGELQELIEQRQLNPLTRPVPS